MIFGTIFIFSNTYVIRYNISYMMLISLLTQYPSINCCHFWFNIQCLFIILPHLQLSSIRKWYLVQYLLSSHPSPTLLYQNMVSPGEVDSELEEETASECSKYGKVVKCTISEVYSSLYSMNMPLNVICYTTYLHSIS